MTNGSTDQEAGGEVMHTARVILNDTDQPDLKITCNDKEHGLDGVCPLMDLWRYDGWDVFTLPDEKAEEGVPVEGEFYVHLTWDGDEAWITYGEGPKKSD